MPAGGNCELTPFGKKSKGFSGRNFDWRFMSGKTSSGGLRDRWPGKPTMPNVAAAPATKHQNENIADSASVLDDFDVRAADGFEQLAGFGFGIFRVARADDQDEFVARDERKAFARQTADDEAAAVGSTRSCRRTRRRRAASTSKIYDGTNDIGTLNIGLPPMRSG